jgi:hypothetical protein
MLHILQIYGDSVFMFLFGFGGYSGTRTQKYAMHNEEAYHFVAL